MRRAIGIILIVLGALLVTLAPVLRWYVAPAAAVAPLECDGDSEFCDGGASISPSSGVASELFSAATLSTRTDVPLLANRIVVPDREISTSDQTIYDTTQAVLDGDSELVTASTAKYAFDGRTSELLDCCRANVDGVPIDAASAGSVMPLKFPFWVEQQDYEYFDATLRAATPAVFTGTEEVEGLEVYVFEQVIEPTQIGELTVPGDLVGSDDDSFTAPRFYANTRTLYVEPTTGVIVNGREQQLQTLRGPDGTDQLTLLSADLAFTEGNVANAADNAAEGKRLLEMMTTTLPLVALLLGGALLAGGIVLETRSRRSAASD